MAYKFTAALVGFANDNLSRIIQLHTLQSAQPGRAGTDNQHRIFLGNF